jgi:hypothetical protein
MLVACRLAGLSALEAYYAGYAGDNARAQFGPTQRSRRPSPLSGQVGLGRPRPVLKTRGPLGTAQRGRTAAQRVSQARYHYPATSSRRDGFGITHRASSPRRFLGQEPALSGGSTHQKAATHIDGRGVVIDVAARN